MSFPILQSVQQRTPSDCAVACLATLLHISYEKANGALEAVANAPADGFCLREIESASERLGYRLKRLRAHTFDPSSIYGIVSVRAPGWWHVTIFWYGLVFDTDGRVWFLEDFLHALPPGASICSALIVAAPALGSPDRVL